MNSIQQQLANCLSVAIRQQEYLVPDDLNIDELMSETKAHDVSGLVYKILKNQVPIEDYRREIIFQSLTQSRYFKQSLQNIKILQEVGIDIVLLKGSILKSLYPLAELRTMGDIDFLVRSEQLKSIEKCLSELGYQKRDSHNEKHDVYDGQGFQFEVHWSLVNESRQSGHESFETDLWQHLQPIEIEGVTYQTLSDEDFLVHLLVHAAGHMKSSGFGIRQLCDITLWIEEKTNLDFDYVEERLKELRIFTFSQYLLETCQDLLYLEVPIELKLEQVNQVTLNKLVETIFKNGVHGHREKENQFGHYFAYGQHKQHIWLILLQCLFPSIRDLSRRYTYAHRYHWLLPVAWIHRFFHVLFHPAFSFQDKLNLFIKTPTVAHQKAALLRRLELTD